MSHSIPSNAIPNLFKGVTFFINDTISTKIRLALEDLLIEWGATKCPPPPPSPEEEEGSKRRFDLLKLTHFITDTLDFPEYDYLSSYPSGDHQQEQEEKKKKKDKKSLELRGDDKFGDGKYKIVTPAWVTRSFDLQVLQQSRFYSPDPSLFLSGTCICTSGLPISDDLTICTATEAFGGQWRRELTREVTHLICVSPHGSKYEMALKFGTELGIAILLPHWFEESLKLGCLVPMEIFRFPNPPFTNSLRDSTNSSIIKPFVERLTDYWKSHLSSLPSNSSSQLPPLTTVPKTSTHVILGLEQGLSLPLNKKLKDSEKYFKSCLLQQQGQGGQQGGGNSSLSRELSDGSLGNRGGNSSSSRSRQQQQVLNTLNSPNDFDSDDGDATENERRRKGGGIFKGKKFYLSSDLGLSRGIEKAIVSKILNFGAESVWSFGLNNNHNDNDEEGGRQAVNDHEDGDEEFEKKKKKRRRRFDSWEKRRLAEKKLRESDFVIMRNREGWEYWLSYSLSSSGGGISIGTPAWLFYTFSQKCLSSPLSRLIHYPPPSQKGVLEFKSKIITVSNYTGLAREYVRTLIELLGAKYEGTMSRQTDFVITSTSLGSKCLHAKNWNIPLCNHLWLESCVLSWQFLSPALSVNYQVEQGGGGGTMFPTILGWRGWTKDAIDKWNLSEERKEERERASKSVDELEKEEEQARTIERMAQQEVVEEEEKDRIEIGEMMIDDEKENVQKEEEEEEEKSKTTTTTKLEKVLPVKEKKRSSTKDQELVPVVDIVNNDNNDNKKKKKKISSKSKTTNGDDDDKEQAQFRAGEEEVEPIRARSKSTKLVSPVRPPPPPEVEAEEQTPPVRSKSKSTTTTLQKKSSKPHAPPPPADVVNGGEEEAESSALSDDDSSSTSSSDEEKKPTPQMSKHFNQIDPHNLVPLGSRRAAAVRGQAKLHDVIEDKNKYDLEQKKKNNSAKKGTGGGGARRSSQIGTTRGESGSPSKRKKKVKSEEEIESDVEMNEGEEEEEEEEKPVVQKKVRGKTKRASTEDGDDGDGDQKPMKKKQRVVNKNLKSVKAGGGGDGDSTTQEGGAISSFDNPPKAKPSSIKSKKVRIISTGLGLDKTSSEIRDLKPFGVSWTDKPQEATHLVVKNLSRTEKFLCALPYTPFIVTKKWIDACIDAKELVDETPYLLKDKKKEQELGETLETILNRARTEGKVFNGKTIYITKGVSPGLPTMQRIVQASGGTIGLNDLKKQHKLIIEDSEALVVSSPNERREWEKLASEGIPIYSCEAVFVATMHQVLEKGFNSDNRVDPQLLA